MRPLLQAARDRLTSVLGRHPGASGPELAAHLGVSVPTLHRLLQEQAAHIVSAGKARRTRYALRRPLRGALQDLPLYEVNREGRIDQIGTLSALHPQGSCLHLSLPAGHTPWPMPDEARDGWWGGLPYPLYDMRPQGYMGRQFALAEHRQLGVPAAPNDWDDDDILHVLNQRGHDLSGNLILGETACALWQQAHHTTTPPLTEDATGHAYAQLAQDALASGVAGSSAAGEFPKFAARRALPGALTQHVLVKFSGADDSPAVTRWSDLLVCEHLALMQVATLPGPGSARSRIVQHAGRTFLELERFDRHGEWGRSRLSSLESLQGAFLGDRSTAWPQLAARLVDLKLLSSTDAERITVLWWFGRLIGNTDMHLGNLSFVPAATLQVAPAYDMLPMMYAPLPGGEVPPRTFQPEWPLPHQRPHWQTACRAALAFWHAASADPRISPSFRHMCETNARTLDHVARQV
ncbi:type II toxin-antitoxin system HipA family toxin YjjJ [Aquabacterium sp.]|uniref:type II toxin-antitoxin system HipA family toxin YjjJ n=1 Tax=Aquabacterium sp. TaxID=1872578 RepID=UPI003B736304